MNTTNASSGSGGPPEIGLAGLTQPPGTSAAPPLMAAPPPAVEPPSASGERRYPVIFSGSGSEYFRIWIVNLLLTLVTLGLYFPWAKVRKLRYFYGNTQVAGHAFDFHGDPKRMLRGYLLVGALFAVYSVAGQISPVAGLIALLILAAIWPALFRAGLRFRMAQTSWRGLRFSFGGTTAGAYKALLPLFIPGLIVVLVAAVMMPEGEPTTAADKARMADAGLAIFGASFFSLLFVPWMWWSIKRYQHAHYRLGAAGTRFSAGIGSFYAVFLKTAGLMLAFSLAMGVLVALLTGLSVGLTALGLPKAVMAIVFAVAVSLVYIVMFVFVGPYMTSRLQNLAWNRTESRALGFDSALRFRPLLGLTLKNWLLILLTLGLYWPFAAIATAKLKLQAVTVVARRDLDSFAQSVHDAAKDATGDAAADVFGLDVGF
jgi:uncharacterized membrane protein YjgN (DUF898 family)